MILSFLIGRDDSNPGADEPGPGTSRAKGLLCSSSSEAHEVQEGQLAQLPGLQAWEAWLGLLWTSGVSAVNIYTCTHGLLCTGDLGVYYRDKTISVELASGSDPNLMLSDVFHCIQTVFPGFFNIKTGHCHLNYPSLFYTIVMLAVKKYRSQDFSSSVILNKVRF